MGSIAPNLSAAIGSEVAARLMGVAGGLLALSRIPACNIQVSGRPRTPQPRALHCRRALARALRHPRARHCGLCPASCLPPRPAPPVQVLGAKRKHLAGLSSTAAAPHQGFVYASGIVQGTPPGLRTKAARLVAAKCALLARVDAYGQDPSGAVRTDTSGGGGAGGGFRASTVVTAHTPLWHL